VVEFGRFISVFVLIDTYIFACEGWWMWSG